MTVSNTPNIKQKSAFAVGQLLTNRVPEELVEELRFINSNFTGTEQREKQLEVAEKFPENLKTELAVYGCKIPQDFLACEVSVGSLLYDLYLNNLEIPESPLNKKALELKVMRLAEELHKDEITLPEFAEAQIFKNLSDDVAWKNLSFTLTYQKDEKDWVVKVSYAALTQYPLVVAAVVDMFSEKL